jgi:HPt (histidine-containing phosphotransfer) domain-containing protein
MVAQFDRAGFRDCLIKPLDRDKLAAVIRDCGLATKAAADDGAAGQTPPAAAAAFDTGALPRRVLETCRRELRSRGQACLGFLTADDRAALLREAHTIRALADMLNMPALAQVAARVEEERDPADGRETAPGPFPGKNVKNLAAASEEAARSIDRYLDQLPC